MKMEERKIFQITAKVPLTTNNYVFASKSGSPALGIKPIAIKQGGEYTKTAIVWPHPPLSLAQPYHRAILTTHPLHRGFQSGTLAGSAIGVPLSHAQQQPRRSCGRPW